MLQAVAGQQYFVRVDIAAGFMKGHGRLTLMDSQQGTYELTSDKLKPLDASKVVDKDRVSVEVAHPQPASQAATQPAPAVSASASVATPSQSLSPAPAAPSPQSATTQPAPSMTSVTTNGVSPSSSNGDSMSLGDAARLARQKKQAQK